MGFFFVCVFFGVCVCVCVCVCVLFVCLFVFCLFFRGWEGGCTHDSCLRVGGSNRCKNLRGFGMHVEGSWPEAAQLMAASSLLRSTCQRRDWLAMISFNLLSALSADCLLSCWLNRE